MSLANDSILVTPGSGATVATHAAGGKEHQVVSLADELGHIAGTVPTWDVATGNTIHVAAARTTLFDLFNASGSARILKVWAVYVIPAQVAVSGVGLTYEIIKTSAVGTGGSALTPRARDSQNTALPATVTSRVKPTGGAATAHVIAFVNGSSEETSPYAAMASVLNHVPMPAGAPVQPILLREGEGLKVDQTTSSNVGNVNIAVVFTAE